VLAMNLTYAEQRALEIGITIAGGAGVVLLDEPTAGMSKSETKRFVELIREVTEGKTLLTVEHDMGVVFGLADKIAVLVYGEVIAFDTPEAVRANAARAGGLPRARCWPTSRPAAGTEGRPKLDAETRQPRCMRSTARAMCCTACTSMSARRDRRLLGRNGSGRSTTVKTIMGLVDARARSAGGSQQILGRKAFEIAHPASATCRRTATSFPS
jgi:ABC-type branched-subunit amino acid transport system ATPase component